MSTKSKYRLLFEECRIGKLVTKNCTIFPPISTNFAREDGHLTDRFVNHYVRRAMGGVALIIVENVCIDYPEGKHGAFEPRMDSYEFISDWKKLVDEVHRYHVKISVELTHPGYNERNVDSLSNDKIEELIEKYGIAAKIGKDAGFDMVEVQGAHGLLINQFLSPLTNHRTDEWGERVRFAVKIRERIAEKCGLTFPISIRLAVDDFRDGGIDVEEGKRIANILARAGYNMIQADVGLGPKEKRLEPMAYEEGWRAELAEKIRPLSVPVAAIGVIRTPKTAEQILEKQADLVVLGRTLLADPDWIDKVKAGKEHLIRKCIGCNECVKSRHDENTAIRCSVNPNLGNEEEIKPGISKKLVAVVGCGPAGLEATRIAEKRGYEVHLFCKEFGGQLNLAAKPPGKDKINWLIEYYENVLKENANIHIYRGEFKKGDIRKINPDVVIMATGAIPSVPCPVIEGMVYTYDKVLMERPIFKNKTIVVGGGGLVGCETANFLARRNKVTIVEMLDDVAIDMETLTRTYLLRELKNKGVKILTKRKIVSLLDGAIIVENIEDNRQEKIFCDILVAAFGNRPYLPYTFEDVPCYIIGDAKRVGKIVDAVHEGYEAAKRLEYAE